LGCPIDLPFKHGNSSEDKILLRYVGDAARFVRIKKMLRTSTVSGKQMGRRGKVAR
jgi:hypothetical protein